MFEDITPESIKEEILSGITKSDTREGSYTNNLISPVALELWKVYNSMNALLPIAYVDETSGKYIDKRASEVGIIRKPGTKAHTELTFTGTNGTAIPKGTVFLTLDGLEFETAETVSILNEKAVVTANAVQVGEKYNVPKNTIINQYNNISGLTSTANKEAVGGTDPENDKSLVNRYYKFRRRPPTSGNAYHYEQWALEVNGVGAAKIIPLVNGPGTVGVLIVNQDRQPVSDEIVKACKAHIEENRPIGPGKDGIIVESAAGLTINVKAVISVNTSTTADKVQNDFTEKLDKYLKSIAFVKYEVLYNQIAYILMGIDGVTDYKSLTINDNKLNIAVAKNQVPVMGAVVITNGID